MSLEDKFSAGFRISETCWVWVKAKTSAGYGVIYQGVCRRRVYAHRASYEIHVGPIPPGMVIDHICHRTCCVNPLHLRAVTQVQNLENRGGLNTNNSSGSRGVSWKKDMKKWRVSAKHNGEQYHGGYFRDLADAERAAVELRNQIHTHNDRDRQSDSYVRKI